MKTPPLGLMLLFLAVLAIIGILGWNGVHLLLVGVFVKVSGPIFSRLV